MKKLKPTRRQILASKWQTPPQLQRLVSKLTPLKSRYARAVIKLIAKLPIRWRWALADDAADVNLDVSLEVCRQMLHVVQNKRSR